MIPNVVVAGTDPAGHGGIASTLPSVLHTLEDAGLLAAFLTTHRSTPPARVLPILRAVAALPGVLRPIHRADETPVLYAHIGGPVCAARSAVLMREARILGARVVVQLHSAGLDTWLVGPRKHALRSMLSSAHLLCAGTAVYAERYRSAALTPVSVVPPMLPLDAVRALSSPPHRPKNGPPTRLGTLTRLVPGKGLVALVEAMSALPEHILTLAGDGPLRADLQDLVRSRGLAGRVRLPGWVHDRDRFFDDVDVYVHPGRNETYGLAMVEAMARGVPVVACDTAVNREVCGEAARYLRKISALPSALTDDFPMHDAGANAQRRAAILHQYAVTRLLAVLSGPGRDAR